MEDLKMKSKLLLVFIFLFSLIGTVFSQGFIFYSDDFSDDDPTASKNIGWLYLDAEQGVSDAVISQVNGELFVRQGRYMLFEGFGIGISVVETNGLPLVLWDNIDSTKTLLNRNNYSLPNQVITFKIRFDRWRSLGEFSSFFSVNTRLLQTQDDSLLLPIADATNEAGYALAIYPMTGQLIMGKYDTTKYKALYPSSWEIFGQTTHSIELKKNYRIKFYLKEGDVKAKFWEDGKAEPAEWLLSAVDPTPKVSGKFTAFGLLGRMPDEGQGDQFYVDDFKVEGWESPNPASAVTDKMVTVNTFQLEQNYPNPFNPNTTISFTLPRAEMTRLVIYNLKGQIVRLLIEARFASGQHQVSWNGLDEFGQPVASGIYLYQLIAGKTIVNRRMVLMK
jgi:hypothetical protein